MNTAHEEALERVFSAFDHDNTGYIEKAGLKKLCENFGLSEEDVDAIFNDLDHDNDGKLTKQDFLYGFEGMLACDNYVGAQHDKLEPKELEEEDFVPKRRPLRRDASQGGTAALQWSRFVSDMGLNYNLLSTQCQEQVCELYQALHAENLPTLLTRFEEIILNVIRDIRQGQYENERLEKSFKREKEAHDNHLRQLEEENEAQMQRVENRVKAELREQYEQEKEQLQSQLLLEIEDLKSNLKRLQSAEPTLHEKAGEENKRRLEDIQTENRFLQSQLTDTQTRLALVRSETATLRQNFEEKSSELQTEKDMLLQYIKEQDNLTRQVHLLHDANQKLHDTNDDLRAALENYKQKKPQSPFRFDPAVIYVHSSQQKHSRPKLSRSSPTPAPKQSSGLPTVSRRGSSGDYVKEYLSAPSNNFASGGSSLADELNMAKPSPNTSRQVLPSQESIESDSIPEDLGTIVSVDSGHSTMRDIHESDEGELERDVRPRKKNRKMPKSSPPDDESDVPDGPAHSEEDMETDFEADRQLSASPSSSVSQASSNRNSAVSNKSVAWRGPGFGGRRQLPAIPQVPRPITGEPERMYKIVLCGDAAVGKSSFIMRLCKNKFVNNLSSTLGVDFQTKVLEVDGRIIALQLWDTAGQERFRSIAKSYFRRADGVLLLYDCTYERSFVNIREWIDAVEDSAQKKVPMMIAGNKTDLRDQMQKNGKRCISYDDGHRLAREYDALFIETSAKEGDFVQETAVEFARLLRTQEDLEVKTVGMQLQDMKSKDEKKLQCCL